MIVVILVVIPRSCYTESAQYDIRLTVEIATGHLFLCAVSKHGQI